MCEYTEIEGGAPYPRTRWRGECGFDFVLMQGYTPNFGKQEEYDKKIIPSGTCMKCKNIIEVCDD